MVETNTNAVYFHARINPRSSDYEEDFLRIVQEKLTEGYNFKQIVMDAVLSAAGRTPEMYTGNRKVQESIRQAIRDELREFMTTLERRGFSRRYEQPDEEVEESGADLSSFADSLADNIIKRQRRGKH